MKRQLVACCLELHPGDELGKYTDRDQRSCVLLDDRKKYFATDRNPPKKNFPKSKTLKNTLVMSQSIPTGYIPPPGNPGENFFERANPGRPGKFFCLIPCPGAKNDGRIPGGGVKFSQTQRNCSLSLQKNP